MDDKHRYDDIIDLPHHSSPTRAHMSIHDRAAQFAPFAALSGHGAAIAETARLTDKKIELDDGSKEIINDKLHQIIDVIDSEPAVEITYFIPDERKSGGKYITKTGAVKKVNDYEQAVIMIDETTIPFENILEIEGDWFKEE